MTIARATTRSPWQMSRTRNLTRSHDLSLLSIARLTGKVAPHRQRPNRDSRTREYLTRAEVEQLLKAAGAAGRRGARDRPLSLPDSGSSQFEIQ